MSLKHPELLVTPPRARLTGRVERIQILEKGIIVKELEGFDNLVLDSGLNLVATAYYASLSRYCAVGTGNAAPTTAQTTLQAETARTGNMLGGAGNCGTNSPSPHIMQFKRTFDFAVGALNGNYSELGFSPNAGANSTLFSRVLIQVSGTPTAITVTSVQQLRVVYTLTVTFGPIVDTAFSLDFGGGWGTISGVAKLQRLRDNINIVDTGGSLTGGSSSPYITGYSGDVLEGFGNFAGFVSSSAAALSAVGSETTRNTLRTNKIGNLSTYVAGSFARNKSLTFAVTEANNAIQSFGIGGQSPSYNFGGDGFVCVMNAPKTKLNTNTLTFNYQITWGR